MTSQNGSKPSFTISESAIQKVLGNNELFRLQCVVEALAEELDKANIKIAELEKTTSKEKVDAKSR
tara:strand:+ start:22 stop:219 length:198 start_codon:yes stop_codon:yes gene_type:complete